MLLKLKQKYFYITPDCAKTQYKRLEFRVFVIRDAALESEQCPTVRQHVLPRPLLILEMNVSGLGLSVLDYITVCNIHNNNNNATTNNNSALDGLGWLVA